MADLWTVMSDLASCLCAELTPDGEEGPGLCLCGVVPGELIWPAATQCDDECGMAWVRLEAAYPSTVPSQIQQAENTCGAYLGADLELGVLRCLPMEDDGSDPTPEQQAEAASQQIQDMLAMRRAVQCCDALEDIDYLLGAYAPLGPNGGLAGGIWTVSVLV